MKVVVLNRDGAELLKGGLVVADEATVKELKNEIHKKASKYYPERQRLTLPGSGKSSRPAVLNDTKRLKDYPSKDHTMVVVFKDLGPQVSYRTLFFFEYLGPLLIYPIFYLFPSLYTVFKLPTRAETQEVQTIAFYYWSLHYVKRILETFFVHKFSHATSPLSNVYRNSLYYSLFAALISYSINHPFFKPAPPDQVYAAFAFGLLCQLANFVCHLQLSSLRSADGQGSYQIPGGLLFDYVTCANYTTEIYQWIGFNLATRTVPGFCFLLVGTMFMANWALQKHARLNKLFDGKDGRQKYSKQWIFLPPIM